MFLTRRPSASEIERLIEASRDLPLSYAQVGIAGRVPSGFNLDQASGTVGRGRPAFERAQQALREWRHFDLSWVERFPKNVSIEVGTTVAILVHHLGFWSINGCRVVYQLEPSSELSFGFAYGTLTNHAELGEEIFEVAMNEETEEVVYKIRAVSKPHSALAWIGYPIARMLQARFRRDSIAALRLATNG